MTLAGSHRHHPSPSRRLSHRWWNLLEPATGYLGVLLMLYATDGPSDVLQDWDDDRDAGSKES